jgi:hypothetical protein
MRVYQETLMRGWFVILVICLLSASQVFAQDDQADPLAECGHNPAALRSAIGADGWVYSDLLQIRWSPTCRYLTLRLPSRHGDPGTTIVWDAGANRRLGVINGYAQGGTEGAWWDARGDYLVIPVDDVGTYLWHMPAAQPMLINTFECGLMDTYWDYDHGRLYATSPIEWTDNWCSPRINQGGYRAYDLNTGAVVAEYPSGRYTLSYRLSPNGRMLILSSYPVGPKSTIDLASGQVTETVYVQ